MRYRYSSIKEEIRKVLSKGKAPGVFVLAFHDAGTFEIDENSGGMNGSIVYELDRPEKHRPSKTSQGKDLLNNEHLHDPPLANSILEKAKTEVDAIRPVSWADIIALAGAEAVSLCGGPSIPLRLGRIDSMVADAEGKLPQESLDAFGLKRCFQRKGTRELVALSGAHTLGSKGFGNPTVFDNSYFKILLEKPWLSSAGMSSMIGLPSDRALVEDDECS
ncbi:unnamed protein product, partial [Thlaspi arvense]